jgi:integrase
MAPERSFRCESNIEVDQGVRIVARKRSNIRTRPDGKAYIAYLRIHGRQVMKSFPKTEAGLDDAELWLERKRAERRRGGLEPRKKRFDDYAAEWLANHPKLRSDTRVLYAQRIRDYLNPSLGDMLLGDITVRHVRHVKDRAAKNGRSGSTQKGVLALLSGILSYAVADEEIPEVTQNPVAFLPARDRPESGEGGKRILTNTELRKLLLAAGKYRLIFAVGGFTGMRKSEVLGLIWDDIHFDEGYIHVRMQLSKPNVYDTSPPHRVPLKTKGKTTDGRHVVLDDGLAKLLKTHRGDRIPRADEWVFKTRTGTPYNQRNVSRAFDSALEDAGITWREWKDENGRTFTDKPTFHGLRHSFASALIAGDPEHGIPGANSDHLARMIGHADSSFTARVYVHQFDAQKRQAESKAALTAAYVGVLD